MPLGHLGSVAVMAVSKAALMRLLLTYGLRQRGSMPLQNAHPQ
jgi:hypothetical protein